MPLQYVQNKPHASEFAFSHVPAACRSCVKNYYMLYMQEERGRERERDKGQGTHMEGGMERHEWVASNVLLPQDAPHAQNKL